MTPIKIDTVRAVEGLLERGWSTDQIASTKGIRVTTVQRIAAAWTPPEPPPVNGDGRHSENLTAFVHGGNVEEAFRRVANRRDYLVGQLAAVDEERNELVRESFRQGISGPRIAEAAGLSRPRIYQIRDHRR